MTNRSSRPQAKADKIEIKLTAERLMNSSGQTTTLQVKNQLRNRNFLAFQNEISEIMEQLANENNWHHVHNGQFRIYSLPMSPLRTQDAHSDWVADLLRVSLN